MLLNKNENQESHRSLTRSGIIKSKMIQTYMSNYWSFVSWAGTLPPPIKTYESPPRIMSHNTEKIDYLLPMWTLTIRLEIYKTYVEKINILCKVTVVLFQRKSSLNHLYGNWWLVDQTNEQSANRCWSC